MDKKMRHMMRNRYRVSISHYIGIVLIGEYPSNKGCSWSAVYLGGWYLSK